MPTLDSKLVEAILKDAVSALNEGVWRPPGGGATASAFEKEAQRQLQVSAAAYGVENKIILHAGRKFPDIVFENSKFGVEIKTAQKGWSCLGNSVMASTLVDGVTEVYLLFGSGERDFSARYAKYEDCVKSVEVTHSPRYVLDMDVMTGGSYLNQIGSTLAEMLTMPDPVGRVVEEARRNLQPGEHVWWISESAPLAIRLWESLPPLDKKRFVSSAFALFPASVLRSPEADYSDFVVWLSQRHSILHPSVRDSFSAGGRIPRLELVSGCLEDVPKVFKTLHRNISEIIRVIRDEITVSDWALYYKCSLSECDNGEKRVKMWRRVIEPLLLDRTGREDYTISCIRGFLDQAVG